MVLVCTTARPNQELFVFPKRRVSCSGSPCCPLIWFPVTSGNREWSKIMYMELSLRMWWPSVNNKRCVYNVWKHSHLHKEKWQENGVVVALTVILLHTVVQVGAFLSSFSINLYFFYNSKYPWLSPNVFNHSVCHKIHLSSFQSSAHSTQFISIFKT